MKQVYVLSFSAPYGDDMSVHKTLQGAKSALKSIIKDFKKDGILLKKFGQDEYYWHEDERIYVKIETTEIKK